MALLGYARVSTSHQKLTAQIMELKSSGVRDDRIFTDMMSGATDEREGLQRLLARAEKDDIIMCTKMDRLGRNTADMIHIVDACYKKGIAIRFLENGLSTEGTMGKMVIQILAAVAEAERERILERTNEGGTVAKLAMRQPFVLFKGLTFQKLCLPGAFRPGDHHNKMLRPGLCVVHASPQYL
ncbi:recombinase family protein [Klebsiella variicola]